MPYGVFASSSRVRFLFSSAAAIAISALAAPVLAQQPPAPPPPPGQYQPPPGQYAPPPQGGYPPPGYQPPPPNYQQPPPGYQQPPPGYQQPPPGYQQPPPGYQQPPPGYQQPPPGYQQPPPGYQQPPPGYQQPPPPAPHAAPVPPAAAPEPEKPTHAPKFSLWAGPRLSYTGFGFGFYGNRSGRTETTGNFVGNGMAGQIDVGARISHRYIPFLFWDHAFLPAGHRFDGLGASASSDFYGIGFRMLSGDVDSVAFLYEFAVGQRLVTVRNDGQSYTMSGLELGRLGIGAEIRVATLFTIEPVASISTGSLNDSSGNLQFAPNQGDGIQEPAFKDGEPIENDRRYVVLSIGVGIHFDIFGE